MTVKELYRELCKKIPSELSCPWDNDGLMCCPDGNREVRKVLVTLDVTADAAERAIEGEFDLIVSHHPFIFKGLKAVDEDNFIAAKAIELIKKEISVMSFHTRLDAVDGGVNDTLAELLGLKNVTPMVSGDEAIGRVGELDGGMSLSALCEKVKQVTGAPFVLCADAGLEPKRIALLGGEGGDDIRAAVAAGADTYISGRLGYHNMTDAADMGINLIEGGHFYTEFPVCSVLAKMLKDVDGNIETEVYFSNRIKAV